MDYYGLETRSLENDFLRLDYLSTAGPRLVRLVLKGSAQNILAEMPNFVVETAVGPYHFRGGHRLWHSPEQLPRTYIPDDEGLTVENLPFGAVRLTGALEKETGLRKSMEVRLAADRAEVHLVHTIRNDGLWAVEFAPWAITQMRLGGVAVLPLRSGPVQMGLLPDRNLVIWPYTRLNDPRLTLGDDLILVRGEAMEPAVKLGTRSTAGWLAYWNEGTLFVKSFAPAPDAPLPDYGCNSEVYSDHRFLELETIGPLQKLEPGQSVQHTETWQVFGNVEVEPTPAALRLLLQGLGL